MKKWIFEILPFLMKPMIVSQSMYHLYLWERFSPSFRDSRMKVRRYFSFSNHNLKSEEKISEKQEYQKMKKS